MEHTEKIEVYYQKVMKNLPYFLPEGSIDVGIELLHEMQLLNFEEEIQKEEDNQLIRYFHVVETLEKITLINDQFVIWIVPDNSGEIPATFTLIALNQDSGPTIEMAFTVRGVYNNSRMVLRVLERFLTDIMENEETIHQLRKAS